MNEIRMIENDYADQIKKQSPALYDDLTQNSMITDQTISLAELSISPIGIHFPYYDVTGKKLGSRIKLSNPTKTQKYHQEGENLNCYFLKSDIQKILNPNCKLIITEGEKKALSISSNYDVSNCAVVSIPGCWNWREKGQECLAKIWKSIPLENREIILIPDTDIFSNRQVANGCNKFMRQLFANKANIDLIDLRNDNDDDDSKSVIDSEESENTDNSKTQIKIGVDDFIKIYGIEALHEKIQKPIWEHRQLDKTFKSTDNKKTLSIEEIQTTLKQNVLLINNLELDKIFGTLRDLSKINKSSIKKELEDIQKQWHLLLFQNTKNNSNKEEENEIIWNKFDEDQCSFLNKLASKICNIDELFIDSTSKLPLFLNSNLKQFIIINSGIELANELAKYINFRYEKKSKTETKISNYSSLPNNLLDTFLSDPLLFCKNNENQIRQLNFYSSIPFYKDGKLVTDNGYNNELQSYLMCDDVKECNGLTLTNQLLDSFAFADEASKTNALGILIGGFFLNHFIGNHPIVIIKGDSPNLGKTTLARAIGEIIFGLPIKSSSLGKNEEETEKIMATCILENNYIFFDNVKNGSQISCAALERSATDEVLNFRKLGVNKSISRINNIQVFITLNDGTFSEDLQVRSVPIFLSENQKHKIDSNFDVINFVRQNREHIIGEIMYLIKQWMNVQSPKKQISFPKYPQWANTINGILSLIDRNEFLKNLENASIQLDPLISAILDYAIETLQSGTGQIKNVNTAKMWYELVLSKNQNLKFDYPSNQATFTKLGKKLSALSEKQFIEFSCGSESVKLKIVQQDTNSGGRNKAYNILYYRPITAVTSVTSSLASSEKNIINIEKPENNIFSYIEEASKKCHGCHDVLE